MDYFRYTHNVIVKNTDEILRNASLIVEENSKTIVDCISDNRPHSGEDNLPTILVPGFINLHAHLCYTDFKLKSNELFTWLKDLLVAVGHKDYSSQSNAINAAKMMLNSGTTFVVDNSSCPIASYEAIKNAGIKGLIGLEVFGSDPDNAERIFNEKIQEINSIPLHRNIELTLSPHASYDVSPKLWQLCINWCNQNNKKLLSHVAESLAEERWFQEKDSIESRSAREFWAGIGTLETKLRSWQAYDSSIDYLDKNNMLDPCLILTHMVHASKSDLKKIREFGIGLVTCPRSNLYLKNGLPDYQVWEELGLKFGAGTDSLASNQSLDLREELKLIKNIDSKKKFELISSDAAQIIGKAEQLGSLEPGKDADFVVLELIDKDMDLDRLNIFDLIIDPGLTKVKSVFVNAKAVL